MVRLQASLESPFCAIYVFISVSVTECGALNFFQRCYLKTFPCLNMQIANDTLLARLLAAACNTGVCSFGIRFLLNFHSTGSLTVLRAR